MKGRTHTKTEVAGATQEEEEKHHSYLGCMGRSATLKGSFGPSLPASHLSSVFPDNTNQS